MIRFSNGDPGGVPSSLRSDSLAGVDTKFRNSTKTLGKSGDGRLAVTVPSCLAQGKRGGYQLLTLVVGGHHRFTIQAVHRWHWGEDQRYRRRDSLQAGGKRSRGVFKKRGTSENFLLGGFNFIFSDLNVFPYPL